MHRPAVLFGGPSPEHDVSILLGLLAARALADDGQEVDALYWTKGGDFFAVDPGLEAEAFLEGPPAKKRRARLHEGGFVVEAGGLAKRKPLETSVVVNCCHGGPGEDGTLQGALDLAGVRYTGPSVAGAALAMDKLVFAAAVSAAGLPHLPVALVEAGAGAPFGGPYIVKPRFGGSSIGIEVFEDWESVSAFVASPQPHLRSGAVVEPYRPESYDLNIAVRTYPQLALSAIEKPLRATAGATILDYRDKYVGGQGMISAPRELPAEIPAAWEAEVRSTAARIAGLASVRGVARIDFLVDADQIYVNEINTIPGSLSKYLWIDPPVPMAILVRDMISEATAGPARAYVTQGADGSALRSAGSISAKLG